MLMGVWEWSSMEFARIGIITGGGSAGVTFISGGLLRFRPL